MKVEETLKFLSLYQTSDDGFTLIEVLISIFIGTIVLTVLYASFFQIIKAKDAVESELELYHEARVIFSRMTEDVRAIYPRGRVYSEDVNFPYPSLIGRKDGRGSLVSFASLSRDPGLSSTDSDQAEVGYYLDPVPESDLFYLMRRENPRIGSDSTGTQYPVSERIVGFNVFYLADAGEEPSEDWNSLEVSSLPRALQVVITMRSAGGENVTFDSAIMIPVVNY